MAERRQDLQVASRAAAQVEDAERRPGFDVAQQFVDILADVVAERAAAEILRAPFVVL